MKSLTAKISGVIALPLLLFLPDLALAKNIEANTQDVVQAMQEGGYKAKAEGSGTDKHIVSASSGYNFKVFFFGCNDSGEGCTSLQFYTSFDPDASPTLKQMNEYAMKRRFGRIYLRDNDDPAIEMDINLDDGGMPLPLFIDNLEYWDSIMAGFADWVFSEDKKLD